MSACTESDRSHETIVGVLIAKKYMKNLVKGVATNKLLQLQKANAKAKTTLFFFSLHDVNMDDCTINGLHYEAGRWWRKKFPFPNVLYNRGSGSKSLRKKLRTFTTKFERQGGQYLNYIRGFNKWEVYNSLKHVPELKQHLPMTVHYRTDEDLVNLLHDKQRLYLKACRGRKGYQVMKIAQISPEHYEYRYLTQDDRVRLRRVNLPGLLKAVHKFFRGNDFLIQEAIDLPNVDGQIVDLRAEVQRDGEGALDFSAICVRVAQKGSPVTTHASSYTFDSYFEDLVGNQEAKQLRKRVEHFLLHIYTALESYYGPMGEIGIDFALDKAGHIWFIECNSQPAKVSLMKAYNTSEIEKAFLNPLLYAKYLTSAKNAPVDKRDLSVKRAEELRNLIKDYTAVKPTLPRVFSRSCEVSRNEKKQHILSVLQGDERDWTDWNWQMENAISSIQILSEIIPLEESEIRAIQQVEEQYRWRISPYYASLLDDDPTNPIRLQAIPTLQELDPGGFRDPMGEEYTNPAGVITRRYPDRVTMNITNVCASQCRHCQRRRLIGTHDQHAERSLLEESIAYVRDHGEIRDVLITGGDPLTMSDSALEWLLRELHAIPTVECIRIGTRVLVTMPQRITQGLLEILKKYPPIYLNTQFNHPLEVTPEAKEACDKLAEIGVVLGNQSVLLSGVNNDKQVMRLLNQELMRCRVRPYYLFHAKHVAGTMHFTTSIDDGVEIMEYLQGYTSGLAVPTYVINAPQGKGKIPVSPEYVLDRANDFFKFRTWEGKIIEYPNHSTTTTKK